jgi:hypothetical protein
MADQSEEKKIKKVATRKALVVRKPFIVPGIGRIEVNSGFYTLPAEGEPKFPYADSVVALVKTGALEVCDIPEESDVRTFVVGMPTLSNARPPETMSANGTIAI